MAVEGGSDLELDKVALLKSLSTSLIPSTARNPGEEISSFDVGSISLSNENFDGTDRKSVV